MYQKKRLSLAVSAALGFSTLIMIPGQVFAQDEQTVEEDITMEEVIVTGSRLKHIDGFGQTSPVTVVGMEEISRTGLTRMEDVLNTLPQVETSFFGNSMISNGASGTASLNLRGLGENRTLVLVNGRRMQPGGVYTEAPDINQIPAAMVERVEVLTGGASATYGADAVAGVVNFIMRRVDGVEISAGWSGYQHDNDNGYIQALMDERNFEYPTGSTGIDGEAYNIDLIIGGDFMDGRGNATLYASWRKNNELRSGERDYSSCALNDAGDGCGGSGNTPVPNFFIAPLTDFGEGPYGYDYDQEVFVNLTSNSTLVDDDGSNRYNYAPINHFMRPDERWSAGGFIDFEINPHAIAYMELGLAHNSTRAQIAESGTFFDEVYPLPLDNSVFPEAFRGSLMEYFPGEDDFGIYIGKRNVEGGPRSDVLTHDAFRVVGGVKGAINDNWDYDISYLNAETSSNSTYINDFLAPSIFTAVNGDLCAETTGCIPYEVFTYQGVTPEQAATLGGTAVQTNNTHTKIFSAYATGNTGFGLSAGEIVVAAGYNWMDLFYENISDTLYEQGLLLGQGGPQPSISGGYKVDEFFAEANIPLLADLPAAQNLTLDLAYRWSDYTTTGSASTYRAGFDWQPIDMLRIRTGYNRAVRAPSINELFVPQNIGLWTGDDPCAGETPDYTAAQCANTGVTASQYGNITVSPAGQYNAMFGGNEALDPEKADTITLGIVITPMDTMNISIDYWDIDIDDVIDNIDPALALDQCALQGNLCDTINRSGNGSLWQGKNGWVWATQLNLGNQHWEGIDLAWTWNLGDYWRFNAIGTYMLSKETTPIPGDNTSTFDCVGEISDICYPSPEWRHVASATYDSNSFWAVTGKWRYYDGVKYYGTDDLIANRNLNGAQQYFDASAVFRFMETHDVIIGVNNILDEEPPMVGNTLSGWGNANQIAGFYDSLGRYFFGNVTFRW